MAMLRAQQKRVDEAWQSQDTEQYESAVQRMGEMVHERAVADINQEPWNPDHWEQQRAALQADYDAKTAAFYAATDDVFNKKPDCQSTDADLERLEATQRAQNEARDRLFDMVRERDETVRERSAQRAAAYRAVIGDIRALGGKLDTHQRSHKQAVTAVQMCADTTPTDWIATSNKMHNNIAPLYVRTSKGRAHYTSLTHAAVGAKEAGIPEVHITYDPDNPPAWERLKRGERWERDESQDGLRYVGSGQREMQYGWVKIAARRSRKEPVSELTVSGTDNEALRVARHEFGHRIEAGNPKISAACLAFRRRRTTDPTTGQRMPKERIYAGTNEYGWRDDFVDHYVGRDYNSGVHTEVFSVGSEAVWNGSKGGLAGEGQDFKADPEHRNLILGLWAAG